MSRVPAVVGLQPLPLHEERVAPEHREDRGAELAGEVDPHPQPRAGVAPHLAERAGERAHLDLLDRHAGVGRVLDDEEQRDREQRPDPGRDPERPLPAPPAQRGGQRCRGGDRAELPDHPAHLGDDRRLLDPEPERDESQHAREDHGVAHAEEHARGEPDPEAPGEGEPQLADRDEREPDEQEPARAEAVQEDAHGDLHAGIHDELDHRERRELRRRDVEAFCRNETGDAERRAVEDGDDVDRQRDGPDDPGATTTDVVDLSSEGSRHRSILGTTPVCRPPPSTTRLRPALSPPGRTRACARSPGPSRRWAR